MEYLFAAQQSARRGFGRLVDGVGGPRLLGQFPCHFLAIFGVHGVLQDEGLWGGGAAECEGGDEAFALETEHQVDVQLGDGYGGEAEAGFGCILEMRAHVCKVDQGHGDGWRIWARKGQSQTGRRSAGPIGAAEVCTTRAMRNGVRCVDLYSEWRRRRRPCASSSSFVCGQISRRSAVREAQTSRSILAPTPRNEGA